MIVAVTVVVFTTVLSIPAGFAFGTMRFPFANLLFYVMLSASWCPFEALIVPLYYGFREHRPDRHLLGADPPQTALSVSFGTFWMRPSSVGAASSWSEAARMDGASSWRILWRVLVPFGATGDPDDGGARLHVDVERVPAGAGDDLGRVAPHGAARASRSRAARRRHPVVRRRVIVAAPVVILYVFSSASSSAACSPGR